MRRCSRVGLVLLGALSVACNARAQQDPTTPKGIIAMADAGQLDKAEGAARAGGAATAVTLGDVLMRRGRIVAADSVYAAVIAGQLPRARSARVGRAEVADRRGDRAGALRFAAALAAEYQQAGRAWSADDLVAVGRAYVVLGLEDPKILHEALAAFDAASAADSSNIESRLLAADLLLDKYNAPDAKQSLEEVLARVPNQPRALLGMARVAAFTSDPGSMAAVRKSLSLNPFLVQGHLLMARFQLEAEEYDSATAAASRALAIDSTALEGWIYLGAVAWMRGDSVGYHRAERAASQVPSRAAEFYSEVAEASARQRRYADAVDLGRLAVAKDSLSARAFGVLGANELRLSDMATGRAHVQRAFELDPYSPWYKNMLDLLDNLDGFRTITTARFQIVAPPEESDYLALTLGPLLERGYDAYVERYQYRPPTPIRVEVYRRHADFSVRTVGLTGLGALGVSFGTLLAMDGPAARDVGDMNFGSTAWHELAHTFTLGLSDNRVPRWVSEGLSVLEEHRAGRGWGADVSPQFLAAYKGGKLPSATQINRGLVRPAFPAEVMFSYFEASQVMEMIEAEHGIAAIRGLLQAYADGLDTPAALRKIFNTSTDDFDARFDRWLRAKYATALAAVDAGDGVAPVKGSFADAMARGSALLEAGDAAAARPYLDRAKKLFPDYGGADGPSWLLAQADRQEGNLRAAANELAVVTAHNETAKLANELESGYLLQVGDTTGALNALDRLLWIAPYEIASHERHATLSEARGDFERAVTERRAILGLNPADRLEARYQLARALKLAGKRDEARREVLRVLEEAPSFEKAQALLLELRTGGGA